LEMITPSRGARMKNVRSLSPRSSLPRSPVRDLRPRINSDTAKRVGVVVIDDQPIVRTGLRAMLACQRDMRFLGEAEDLESALVAVERLRPDVILVDATLAGCDDAAVLRAVLRAVPGTPILALGLRDGDEEIFQVLAAGAAGYLLKTAAVPELIVAIRETYAGGRYLSRKVQAQLDERRRWPVLTARQREVVALLAEGRTNAAIAAVLDISSGTVKLHVKSILAKLGAEDRAEAAIVALRRGFARIS
jgi:two-component system, NarL family, response regulator